MASDTAPAAVPGPDDSPFNGPGTSTSAPQPGGLSGLLAAVEPARPAAFTLNPTTGPAVPGQEQEAATPGASSASYHPDDNTPNNSATATAARQQTGVVRAWMLAGAERWKKGGDARNKRLDIQKARAQQRQVKEQVTVNRTEKMVGGYTNSSTGSKTDSGKSLSSKNSGGGSAGSKGGPKNSSGTGHGGSSGRSGSGSGGGSGRGSGGGAGRGSGGTGSGHSGSAGGRGKGGLKDGSSNGHGFLSKGNGGGSKTDKAGHASGGNNGSGSGKAGQGGPGGSNSKKPGPSVQHTTARETPPDRTSRNTGGTGKGGKDTPSLTKTDKTKTPAPPAAADKSKGSGADKVSLDKTPKSSGQKTNPATTPGAKQATGTDKTAAPGTGAGKQNGSGPKNATSKKTLGPHAPHAPRPRINTRDSRETGYRDGTRAARAAAHVEAYRDGVKDGWTDTKQAAEREKKRLDKAHQDHTKARDEDQPVTAPVSSADYHPAAEQTPPGTPAEPGQATPIPVTNADPSHIQLGDGAARQFISRGEVRTLKSFQTRLDAKTDTMTRIADATRALKAHADEQAKQVTTLLEQAKAVHGGDKLVATLTKLEEAAKIQAGKAEEIHKRALRAAEACKALNANTETRYGGIYQAVADSGETAPATMTYYKESANA